MVVDFDDFGCNHIISGQCQSHDCREKLDALHYANPNFKVTLFTIPGEMTPELLKWCEANSSWVELAVHGFYHTSNYECSEMSYGDFDGFMRGTMQDMIEQYFVKGFKAPGWQISDGAYQWLAEHGWWVADQAYNNARRPTNLPAYVVDNNVFVSFPNGTSQEDFEPVEAWHGHTWDCVGNGIYETFDQVKELVVAADDFKFVSEVLA